jgi:hypothetical protein
MSEIASFGALEEVANFGVALEEGEFGAGSNNNLGIITRSIIMQIIEPIITKNIIGR